MPCQRLNELFWLCSFAERGCPARYDNLKQIQQIRPSRIEKTVEETVSMVDLEAASTACTVYGIGCQDYQSIRTSDLDDCCLETSISIKAKL
jgi:hypothetical protein